MSERVEFLRVFKTGADYERAVSVPAAGLSRFLLTTRAQCDLAPGRDTGRDGAEMSEKRARHEG